MSLYRVVCSGKADLCGLIENSRITKLTTIMPNKNKLKLKSHTRSLNERVRAFVDVLFLRQDYVLRIFYERGGEEFYVEAANEGGEVRYNLYAWSKTIV